jgi:hypothetical protein
MVDKANVDIVETVLVRTLDTAVHGFFAFLSGLEHVTFKGHQIPLAEALKESAIRQWLPRFKVIGGFS